MKVEIRDKPSFANMRVHLSQGDRLVAEADAMASMSSTVSMRTRWNGGVARAVAKRIFADETLFVNEYTTASEGEVVLTQPFPGDIECLELKGSSIYLQPGAFVACDPGVYMKLGWAGIRSWVGREGLFRLCATGTGRVWFGAYGGIFCREVETECVVDTGHLVGYEPTVRLQVGMAGGIVSSFLSGEGLVMRIKGPGRIYLQSRSMEGLAAWANSHL